MLTSLLPVTRVWLVWEPQLLTLLLQQDCQSRGRGSPQTEKHRDGPSCKGVPQLTRRKALVCDVQPPLVRMCHKLCLQGPPGKKQRTGLFSDDNKRWLKPKAGLAANGAPRAAATKRKANPAPQPAQEPALVEEDSDSGEPPPARAWPWQRLAAVKAGVWLCSP